MSSLEILGMALTVLSVLLTVFRRIEQFPVGLVAVTAFAAVFWQARLYASATLQALFACLTLYGWWYWLRGSRGAPPAITNAPLVWVLALTGTALLAAAALGALLSAYSDARMTYADSSILGLSVAAQILLDRKMIEHWFVWAAVNMLSIVVYAGQGLTVTALLYAGLLANTAVGYIAWRSAMRAESGASAGVGT